MGCGQWREVSGELPAIGELKGRVGNRRSSIPDFVWLKNAPNFVQDDSNKFFLTG